MRSRTSAPSATCSGSAASPGAWETPSRHGMKSIADGASAATWPASCPPPLASSSASIPAPSAASREEPAQIAIELHRRGARDLLERKLERPLAGTLARDLAQLVLRTVQREVRERTQLDRGRHLAGHDVGTARQDLQASDGADEHAFARVLARQPLDREDQLRRAGKRVAAIVHRGRPGVRGQRRACAPRSGGFRRWR